MSPMCRKCDEYMIDCSCPKTVSYAAADGANQRIDMTDEQIESIYVQCLVGVMQPTERAIAFARVI